MAMIYLFDWGDTLMVDFPGVAGKMCDWTVVKAVPGAQAALAHLAASGPVYVATGAADSIEEDIQSALARVGLDEFISGYFCQANLGIAKGSADFYLAILAKLGVEAKNVTMVGDTYDKDILPALEAGLAAIWLNPGNQQSPPVDDRIRQIVCLDELS